jgi:copper chaperone
VAQPFDARRQKFPKGQAGARRRYGWIGTHGGYAAFVTDMEEPIMTTTIYEVRGMTCDHCVRAVREEVGKLDGVQGVDVELSRGLVTVTSAGPMAPEAVASAIDEAGYELVA